MVHNRCCTERAFEMRNNNVRWIVCRSPSKGGSSCAHVYQWSVSRIYLSTYTEMNTTLGTGEWAVRANLLIHTYQRVRLENQSDEDGCYIVRSRAGSQTDYT